MLTKLEKVDWVISPANFVQALAPRQVMSRDSHAMSQGLQPPLHLNVEAAIVSNTTTLRTCREFMDDAIRLCRQVRSKLAAVPDAKPLVASADHSDADARVTRQLVRRSIALFVVLALVVIAGVVVALRQVVDDRLAKAVVIVGAGLALAGLYALLVNRAHAGRALGIAAAIGGAIAALDQLLA